MDEIALPVTTKRRARRVLARVLLAGLAILLALVLDLSPTVPALPAPTGAEARRVHDAASRARYLLTAGVGYATLRFAAQDLASAGVLASSIERLGRFDARINNGQLILRASRRFAIFWLNGEIRVSQSRTGFPTTRLKLGDLQLGAATSRGVLEGVRTLLLWRGVTLPQLDDLVRGMRADGKTIDVDLHFPLNGAIADKLSMLRAKRVDPALTASIYCRLIAEHKKEPVTSFAAVVNHAFRPISSSLPQTERNRAALAAAAMFTVGPTAGSLAGDASKRVARCRSIHPEPLLAGRADLAKHWAMSAAIGASLGEDVGSAMGEWKELSDSRPGGSGFSFVDLSADRAGLAVARNATDPETAEATARRLRNATAETLLPLRALALAEGLTEAQFARSYIATDSAKFAEAKRRIDRILASTINR